MSSPGSWTRQRNPRWNGGVTESRHGYRLRLCLGHPHANRGGSVPEHRLIVEWVIGHTLAQKNEVHHVNEQRADNSPGNLVACEDRAYHRLLHQRGAAVRAGYPAFYCRCLYCKYHDNPANMVPYGRRGGWHFMHRSCHAAYELARYHRAKAQA